MTGRKPLDDLDLSLPVDSAEGLSTDYVSRMRIQYLAVQSQTLAAQVRFADAKAGILMAVIGIVAARGTFDTPLDDPLTGAVLAVSALCLLSAILAILPRYPDKATRQAMYVSDRFSWPSLAETVPAEDYADFMRTSEASQLVMSMALSNQAQAGILLKKFRMLRLAFLSAGLVILLLALRLAIGLVGIPG
ncbi:MAG: hypothetical protein KDI98_02425 [Hyphomicrobiaceae bacterium]|nr:hypothetical protein [Hyphomicrobiaceae bacterium]